MFIPGNDHLVELLDGSFFLSNVRQQLDSAYRFPTALAQPTTVPTSYEDAKIRSMPTNLELEDNRISIMDLKDVEVTKYDDELPMGFTIQLLTDEVLEQYPQLDPQKRPIKVANVRLRSLSVIEGILVLSNAQSTSWSLSVDKQCRCFQNHVQSTRIRYRW